MEPVDQPEQAPEGPIVVEPGDTWASAAARTGVDADDLIAANGGTHRPLIVGEELAQP